VVQEAFYNAYKNYAGYSEQGKIRAWLKTIARNIVYKSYNAMSKTIFISFDAEDSPLLKIMASNEIQPDEKVVRDEFMNDILRLIAKLPKQQRLAVTYRYAHSLSISETSCAMSLPEGTVKSNASYGLKTLRNQLGIETKKPLKGAMKMKKCIESYGLLFEYAKGYLTKNERAEVEAHIATCTDCAEIIKAMSAIWPYLQKEFNESGYTNYFNVAFQTKEGSTLSYTGMNIEIPESQVNYYNKILDENNGKIPPEGQGNFKLGHDADMKNLSIYSNEGGKVEFETKIDTASHSWSVLKAIPKAYETHWMYSVYLREHSQCIKQSKDAPNLYEGHSGNNLGAATKCGIFVNIASDATNIRIKKGSGVLELDNQIFAYSQRFAAKDEKVDLTFTYNK